MPQTDTHSANPAPGTPEAAEWTRIELARCLSDTAQFSGVDMDACERLHQKFADMTFNLVVAGQFKRGKSSVINALLGEPLLPTGVVPLTSIVTVLRYGHAHMACVQGQGGEEKSIPMADLATYVTERGNPHNELRVRQVLIDHSSRWLEHGVRLIDTPGIGSVYQHNTDVAQQFMPQADAVLFIVSVDQPLGSAEMEFLAGVREYADKIFCLLNKSDYLAAVELRESIGFVTEQMRAAIGPTVPVFAVSAKLALEGKQAQDESLLTRSGFPAFEAALRRFMVQDKGTTWLRSVGRNLLRILSQLGFTLELESKLLTAPQAQLDENLAAFRRKRLEVTRSGNDQQVLLEADALDLLKNEIEPGLLRFKEELKQRVRADIEHWYADFGSLSSRASQEALEQRLVTEVRAAYDRWLTREDAQLCFSFQALCARHAQQLQAAVDELMRYSSELFSVRFDPVRAEGNWSLESDFYYKFWYEPTSLKILATSAMLALPKALAGRWIVKRARERALELVESHAGRIRHDLEERLKNSVRGARRQILMTVQSIVERIETAIENGLTARERTETHVAARQRELTEALRAAESIKARMRALMP